MVRQKSVELPKGFKPIKGLASSWEFETDTTLTGKITEFRSIESRYKDQKTGKHKMQRNATVARDSDGRLVTVWESAGTRPLFDLKVGTHVFLSYDGTKKIKGRAQPMRVFTIAVQS